MSVHMQLVIAFIECKGEEFNVGVIYLGNFDTWSRANFFQFDDKFIKESLSLCVFIFNWVAIKWKWCRHGISSACQFKLFSLVILEKWDESHPSCTSSVRARRKREEKKNAKELSQSPKTTAEFLRLLLLCVYFYLSFYFISATDSVVRHDMFRLKQRKQSVTENHYHFFIAFLLEISTI